MQENNKWYEEYLNKSGLTESLEGIFNTFYDDFKNTAFSDYVADNADIVRKLIAEVCH